MVRGWFPRRGRNTNCKNFNIRFFRFATLRTATNNFSTLVARGGYGNLFKGILSDRRAVAILRLHKPYRDGFLEMVEFMSHLRHVNLLQIVGCCVENNEQLLVSEFPENGSVWHHLQSRKRSVFNWERRAAVCIGIARGLMYLHEEIDPRVIHRSIKPSNILLDANFVPKIADFDLVDLVDDCLYVSEGQGSKKPRQGFAHPFPRNVFTGQSTDKLDVYSFGVTVLEIITGRNSIDIEIQDWWILRWVKTMKKNNTVLKIVDPMLTNFPKEDVERFINVALLCTHPSLEERPSMFQVVHMLYGRHISDQQISNMASSAAAYCDPYPAVSLKILTIGTSEKEEMGESEAVNCSSAKTSVEPSPSKSGSASSGNVLEQNPLEDVARTYFERSMEKIMRYQAAMNSANHVTTMTTTTTKAGKKKSQHTFTEAVYPPFLSGRHWPALSKQLTGS